MLKKYNLALTPISKGSEVTHLVQRISQLADSYLLGDDSLPHVTLYQFEATEMEIESMWQLVSSVWEATLVLEFNRYSCKTFDNITYWVALMPDNLKALHSLHSVVANAIQKPIRCDFEPHMTLLNTRNKDCQTEIEPLFSAYQPMMDRFTLSLGSCDKVGQFTKMIHRLDE